MPTTVGIMSMQRIHNYGSSLQAYGLRRLIQGIRADARVGFVDYRPGDVLVTDGATVHRSPARRAIGKVTEYLDVDAPLRDRLRFVDHKRAYGRRYFPLVGIPPEPVHDLDLDVQVIGSDEVFNCVQSNSNVGYSRDLFGHDSPARRLISYAASFGNTTIDKIERYGLRDELARDLSRFDALSVRDANSARVVEELTGTAPELHVDPVLAHDFMRCEPQVPLHRLHGPRYVIVYGYSGRLQAEENAALVRYARSIGAEILTFGGVQGCGDRFVECSPLELLAYFRDAEAVVTDTFHGTILSIINHRPFGAIIRRSVGDAYGNEEKLGFLLERFGLASRRVDDLTAIGEILSNPVDYSGVEAVLEHERARTRDYLSANIARAD